MIIDGTGRHPGGIATLAELEESLGMHTIASPLRWSGPTQPRRDPEGIYQVLADLEHPCHIVATPSGVAAVGGGAVTASSGSGSAYGSGSGTGSGAAGEMPLLAAAPALLPRQLGAVEFQRAHQVRQSYLAGAMAGGIASADLVIALARQGLLASFGAAGLPRDTIDRALTRFAAEIPGRSYAVNLIHSPNEERMERQAVELFLQRGVRCVEASAYSELTEHVVRYRLVGLRRDPSGRVVADHKLIAKVSRRETAELFLRPAPADLVRVLLDRGLITAEQASCAGAVPMADDLTAEADSGGHTDRRPLPVLLPALINLAEAVRVECGYQTRVRVGAAGGLGTPAAVAAAFAMGAAYVVTGSVNQSCVEAGTSPGVKAMLAAAEVTDCDLAPSADLLELGARVQVLRRGTLFPMRASQLYQLYQSYESLESIPGPERAKLERQVFRRSLAEVWQDCVDYFQRRDPEQLDRARGNPKRTMALVFRWYLGMGSRWAISGAADRISDYQIWCGPAMGAFNDWVAGSYLAAPENRRVAEVAHHLMRGAAFVTRLGYLRHAGVALPVAATVYRPRPLTSGVV